MLLFFLPVDPCGWSFGSAGSWTKKNGWLMTIGAYTWLVDDHWAKTMWMIIPYITSFMMIIHMRYRGWSSRMWESGYQLIWKKRDDTGLFWTRRKFVNATTRSQERMTISGDSHVRQRSQRILDPVLTLFTVVLKVCKSTDVPKRDWCRMTYHLARLILDGYFNPLVFWYQWEYLLTSKEFNFLKGI